VSQRKQAVFVPAKSSIAQDSVRHTVVLQSAPTLVEASPIDDSLFPELSAINANFSTLSPSTLPSLKSIQQQQQKSTSRSASISLSLAPTPTPMMLHDAAFALPAVVNTKVQQQQKQQQQRPSTVSAVAAAATQKTVPLPRPPTMTTLSNQLPPPSSPPATDVAAVANDQVVDDSIFF
jgi:hypothetical protein